MRFTLRRARHGALLLLLPAVALMGCGGSTSTAVREARPFAPTEYRIGIEDLLEINVWREPQLSTTAPVRPDGKVTVPVAGEVEAAGHTAKELEALLTKKLSERIASPTVTVVVKEINGSRVFVLGEVTRPGGFPLRGPMSVVQAIALAGGRTEFARDEVVWLRQKSGAKTERVSLSFDDLVKGEAAGALWLAGGDVLYVR